MVTEVGPGVEKLQVGDRVMYMSSGCFTTHITLSQTLCVKLDDGLTFEQGAALPCVYATAAMALVDKANLQPGQVRRALIRVPSCDRANSYTFRQSSFIQPVAA